MPLWSFSKPALPKIIAYSPDFWENRESAGCVGLDEGKKLWLIFVSKKDIDSIPNDRHHERKVNEFYPISSIEKRMSGGLLIAAANNDTPFFYLVERLQSGKILSLNNPWTLWDPLCRPQRVFLKQGHAEFDLLECLFNPQA